MQRFLSSTTSSFLPILQSLNHKTSITTASVFTITLPSKQERPKPLTASYSSENELLTRTKPPWQRNRHPTPQRSRLPRSPTRPRVLLPSLASPSTASPPHLSQRSSPNATRDHRRTTPSRIPTHRPCRSWRLRARGDTRER